MRPHNAHVKEYIRHIYPTKYLIRLILPVFAIGFLLGVFVVTTFELVQCTLDF